MAMLMQLDKVANVFTLKTDTCRWIMALLEPHNSFFYASIPEQMAFQAARLQPPPAVPWALSQLCNALLGTIPHDAHLSSLLW